MDAIQTGVASAMIDTVLISGLVASIVTDLRHRKIYDRVTVPCMAAGVLLNIWLAGWAGAGASLAGMAAAVALALAVTLAAGRGLGGGDVKLLAAVGALCGPHFVLWAAAFAALSVPALCLIPLLRDGLLIYTIRNFTRNMVVRFVAGMPVDVTSGSRAGKQPFSVAIAAGVILAACFLWR